jgi:hypothetical protein
LTALFEFNVEKSGSVLAQQIFLAFDDLLDAAFGKRQELVQHILGEGFRFRCALDLDEPAFQSVGFSGRAGLGASGEQGVFRRHPAFPTAGHPTGDAVLDAEVAEHSRIAPTHQHGTFCIPCEVRREGNRAELVNLAPIRAGESICSHILIITPASGSLTRPGCNAAEGFVLYIVPVKKRDGFI